ncbi:TRAP transporter substrate-binding protein [Paracoccaceae bacterium]|jgi:TRAP-type C4-dicarboxylate transport system substrate-binding protein|nr:C4-dicarboxylate ABC transporter [Gammaproteobacteria bacterium]MBF20721.1 C4-dicarboxylate ABC transporter [Marinovum sp.]MBT3650897.1 TRAP transporter substrate-binding protein [Paracoccaceae bacterium]WQC62823.1 TRAP transporter substrate-binding protein [Alphaproteobacteria bacterium US3C007]MBT4229326.1 TRAP transporter substrate-binding protein [Paracoccaceae bacterium]|tara:strand:- start:13532 stop:14686 length:1155 start_codon:yes stop_codon:yes gene_type:complete
MKLSNENKNLKSATRRNFLKLAGSGSFTAAMVAGAAGTLWSTEAAAQTASEERDREKAADHVMTIATAYVLGATRSYPIMQLDLKENIQNATSGKVYVKLAPGGQLGAGGALAQKVQSGTIQAAQHSLSNFAPFASTVDLINMPYLCGSNQRFTNLVHSDTWAKAVNPNVEAAGFKALFYVNIDPRVVAVRKGGAGAVMTPGDLSGVKFRVPGSAMLQQYYRMVGANPTPVAWGETPSAIKQGVADALDPSVGALYVFGFKDILSHVTFTQAVPDSQVYSCNLEWFNSMPADVQDGIMEAAEITRHQNLSKVPSARNYAMAELRKSGVQFHSLSEDQLAEWQSVGGYQNAAWDSFKVELAGSMDTFAKLEEAAGTQGRYYVHDA